MSFTQFYQQGGLFMHPITLVAMACGASLVQRILAARRTMTSPTTGAVLDGGSTVSLVATGLMLGTVGTVFGLVEVCAAVQSVPAEMLSLAAARGGAIALTTLAFALLVLTPVMFMHTLLRPLERRITQRCNVAAQEPSS